VSETVVADSAGTRVRTRRSRSVRVVRIVLTVVVVLVAVFYVGGGAYLAGVLHTDLVVAPHPEGIDDLRISPVGTDRLALEADPAVKTTVAPLARARSSSTYGVVWKGGFGQVSGPAISDRDGRLVKSFKILAGSPPAAGVASHLVDYAFPPDDPSIALGSRVSQVDIRSAPGVFPASLAMPADQGPAGAGSTWAVLVHGQSDTRTDMFRMMQSTLAENMPSLAITYLNDDGVPQTSDRLSMAGKTEWMQVAAAVRYAGSHGATHVVLFGNSMGGGIVASYLRHRAAGDEAASGIPVSGVVLDSPMLDLRATVDYQASLFPFPLFGHPPASLVWVGTTFARWRYGFDWTSDDYLDGASWVKEPVLIMHGTADTSVPLATSERLAAEHPALVTLHRVRGAGHVESWNTDPARYRAIVGAFLRAHS